MATRRTDPFRNDEPAVGRATRIGLSAREWEAAANLPWRANALAERVIAGGMRRVDIAVGWRDAALPKQPETEVKHHIDCDLFDAAPPLAERAGLVWQRLNGRLVLPITELEAASRELEALEEQADALLARLAQEHGFSAVFAEATPDETRRGVIEEARAVDSDMGTRWQIVDKVQLEKTRLFLRSIFNDPFRIVDRVAVALAPPPEALQKDWLLQRRLMNAADEFSF